MKRINCIGDSHISVFSETDLLLPISKWENHDRFNIFHAGPRTAYGVFNKQHIINACNSIPGDEYVLLCFGEIDGRCRVHLAGDKYKNIELIANNYFKLIDNIPTRNIIVLSVTPCLVEDPFKEWHDANPGMRRNVRTSTRGTMTQRNEYKRYLNNCIRGYCDDKDYIFVDIWNNVLHKPDMYRDDIHLSGVQIYKTLYTLLSEYR